MQNTVRSLLFATLLFCLLCSCQRRVSAPLSSLTHWQSQQQALALPASVFSDGMNLFLPPAPVFYASLANDAQASPLGYYSEEAGLGALLSQYCQYWNQALARQLPARLELPGAFSLPPPPWSVSIGEEDFRRSGIFLYQGLQQAGLPALESERLQLLLLYHEQQLELLKTLRFIDMLNRGKDCDLVAALRQFRAYASFRQKFARRLENAVMPELLTANQLLDEFLLPWLSLPELQTPLQSLPSLWMSVPADEGQPPLGEKMRSLSEWSARQPEARRYAEVWEELQEGKNNAAASQGFTWMVAGFASPEIEEGQQAFVFALPLPEESEIYLNGKRQYSQSQQACLLPLPAAEAGQEQLLALKLPNACLCSQLWAPWLLAVEKPKSEE